MHKALGLKHRLKVHLVVSRAAKTNRLSDKKDHVTAFVAELKDHLIRV